MLTQVALAQVVGVPVNTLASWRHRGVIPEPEGAGYDVAESLCVAALVAAMRAGKTVEAARAAVAWQVPMLGQMATAMVRDRRLSETSVVVFIEATFAGIDPLWRRLVCSRGDRERVIAAALRCKELRRLEVTDFTEPYMKTLLAFIDARAEQRERVLA